MTVLATGKRTAKSAGQGDSEATDFSTITLQLTPDDAARVLLAQRTGAVTAVLRGGDDAQPQTLSVVHSRQLLMTNSRAVTAANSGSAAPPTLQVIAGGGGGVRSVQQLLADLPTDRSAPNPGESR